MQLGVIGLGRMGANMVQRLHKAGHSCVVYDVNPKAVEALSSQGATGATDLADLASKLSAPRAVWVMVPAAVTGDTVTELAKHLERGDTIIDGGNSFYVEDIARAKQLQASGIHYVDVGTSGGVFGLERGYCLMIGGDQEPVERLTPIFEALAPGFDSAPRTPGRAGSPAPEEQGWLHCGPHGAGHFVKMVHNGIEYGLMAAYAEGLAVLHAANAGKATQEADAETAPLTDPERYQYDLDVAKITEVWRRGSVVASWLLDLTAEAFAADHELSGFAGRVSDSGEGRWTVHAAVDLGVPAHTLAAALFERFESRGHGEFAGKILSAMRKEFGGHDEKPASAS
jgi:6-phosphogluconate dehydrogenase